MMMNEETCDLLRQISGRTLAALRMVAEAPVRPSFYDRHNGRGEPYCVLRYRIPGPDGRPGAEQCFHVGQIPGEEVQLIVRWLDLFWQNRSPGSGWRVAEDDIVRRVENRNEALREARECARQAGHHFRGHQLRRSRQPTATEPDGSVDALYRLRACIVVAIEQCQQLILARESRLLQLLNDPLFLLRVGAGRNGAAMLRAQTGAVAREQRMCEGLRRAPAIAESRIAQVAAAA